MKQYFLLLAIVLLLNACSNQKTADMHRLQTEVDSLREKSYKPRLGEFMMRIQVHHSKLWFAGISQNWQLANFEMTEIKEAINGIREYCAGRSEVKLLRLMDPALDSVNVAITQKNTAQFKSSYLLLTNTCNDCHHATKYVFNVIKVPDIPPYSNQDFKVQ